MLNGLTLSDARPRWIDVDWDALVDIAVGGTAGLLRRLIYAKFFFLSSELRLATVS